MPSEIWGVFIDLWASQVRWAHRRSFQTECLQINIALRVIIGTYFLLQSSNKIVSYKRDCTMPNEYSQDNASMDDDAISYVSAESDFDDDDNDDAMSHKSTSTLANIRSDIKVCL